jgi:hypothetical protein
VGKVDKAEELDGISPKEKSALDKIEKIINGNVDYLESWRLSDPFNN